MKNHFLWATLVLGCFLLFTAVAEATDRQLPVAGQKKPAARQPQELPPEALQAPSLPDEIFMQRGPCSKEEMKTLDDIDKRFLDISHPEKVSMDRDDKETIKLLMDREFLRNVIDIYVRCGREPAMHEFDPSTFESDMEFLERVNRR